MTTKLNFRARTLDASKPMAIYNAEDLPELAEANAINRSVPAMPSGMEKEEEAEKHLQDILELQSSSSVEKKQLTTDLYIPTPEVFLVDDACFLSVIMRNEYKVPRQYIHVQPFSVDVDTPDYDMDEEDEQFLESVLRKQRHFEVGATDFEDMIDRLEKNSGQTVVSAKEAKLLLKGDDELILAVYDYWVDKRLRLKQPLMPMVKSDKRDIGVVSATGNSSGSSVSGSSANANTSNPYIAFRRRTEKMQTRKNRKNDETSYEKMLKLRRDLSRAVVLLEMVKRREKMKKENLMLTAEIFEKRFQAGDYDGKIMAEVQTHKAQASQYYPNYAENWLSQHHLATVGPASSDRHKDRSRKEKKRKHQKSGLAPATTPSLATSYLNAFSGAGVGPEFGSAFSSDEEPISGATPSDTEDDELEGPFAFKRKRNVQYLAPLCTDHEDEDKDRGAGGAGGWPWESVSTGGGAEPRYRYSLASLSNPKPRSIGFARRRVGRGGRFVLDRAYTDFDELWKSLDFTVIDSKSNSGHSLCVDDDWPHYRPVTPPHCKDDWNFDKLTDGLPILPIKPIVGMAVFRQHSLQRNRSGLGIMKPVPVDSLGAQNAAAALVSSVTMELFRP